MRLKIVQFSLSILISLLTYPAVYADDPARKPAYSSPFLYSGNLFLLNTDFSSQQTLATTDINPVFQPYLSEGISFYSRSNFNLSLQGGIAFNSDTSFTESAYDLLLGGGYTLVLSPSLALRPSYSHFEYSGNNTLYYSVVSDMLQFDIYYQRRAYYSALFTSFLFGKRFQVYSTWKNGIAWYPGISANTTILPGVALDLDISISDKNYYNEFVYLSWNEDEFLNWIDIYYPDYSAEIRYAINSNGFEPVTSEFLERLKTQDPELFEPTYTLSAINISLPLSLSGKRTYFYVTPLLMIPLSSVIFYEQQVQFIINAGFSFSFR